MKIRSGFVSNSSSSSFVVYVKNYDTLFIDRREDILNTITSCYGFVENNSDLFDDCGEVIDPDNLIAVLMDKFYSSKEFCEYEDDDGMIQVIRELEFPTLAAFDVSSDSGSIVIVTDKDLEKVGAK